MHWAASAVPCGATERFLKTPRIQSTTACPPRGDAEASAEVGPEVNPEVQEDAFPLWVTLRPVHALNQMPRILGQRRATFSDQE
jgi:hypothetical protein